MPKVATMASPINFSGVPFEAKICSDIRPWFLTVVEVGSFAAAGQKLGRATSAVSYAIADLEQQLGVQLFDRDRTRKPTLTEVGASVLSEVRTVSVGVDNLRAKLKGTRVPCSDAYTCAKPPSTNNSVPVM
jgi:hypothetical protein